MGAAFAAVNSAGEGVAPPAAPGASARRADPIAASGGAAKGGEGAAATRNPMTRWPHASQQRTRQSVPKRQRAFVPPGAGTGRAMRRARAHAGQARLHARRAGGPRPRSRSALGLRLRQGSRVDQVGRREMTAAPRQTYKE